MLYRHSDWLDGQDLEIVLPSLSVDEQYRLGIKAGEMLKSLHSLAAPAEQPPWDSRFQKKMDLNAKKYLDCPIKFKGDHHIFSYIEKNRHLLKNRPQTFQHGDYHCGNMVINQDNVLGIIDFNRFDYGDPWEEFNRIVFCAVCSAHFASGRIDGYFGANVPEQFFSMLALYIGANTLSSIHWAIPFGQKEIDTMTAQAALVLAWFQNMENPVPSWYVQG